MADRLPTTFTNEIQYEPSIDYTASLELPLSPKDKAWAQKLARAHGNADDH